MKSRSYFLTIACLGLAAGARADLVDDPELVFREVEQVYLIVRENSEVRTQFVPDVAYIRNRLQTLAQRDKRVYFARELPPLTKLRGSHRGIVLRLDLDHRHNLEGQEVTYARLHVLRPRAPMRTKTLAWDEFCFAEEVMHTDMTNNSRERHYDFCYYKILKPALAQIFGSVQHLEDG